MRQEEAPELPEVEYLCNQIGKLLGVLVAEPMPLILVKPHYKDWKLMQAPILIPLDICRY